MFRSGRFKRAYEISRPSFTFHSSRMPDVFKAALEPLGGQEYKLGDDHIDLLYTSEPPANIEGVSIGVNLMHRRATSALDNKAKCAKALAPFGLSVPRTYFRVEDVPDDPDTMWYIKDPIGTGGVGVSLVSREEVASNFTDGYLIQEAVQDIVLLEGKKFTLRLYVLIHEGIFYLFQDALVVLHGVLSPAAAVKLLANEDGYRDSNLNAKIFPFSDISFYNTALANIETSLGQIFRRLKQYTPYEQVNTYCLLGIDMLLTSNLQPVLIEINDRPNLAHTTVATARVTIPAIQAMYSILNFGSQANLIGVAKKFEPLEIGKPNWR